MVLAESSEHGIPQSKLGLGQIATNKIALLGAQPLAGQHFFGEQEAGAAVEEQPGRLGKGDFSSLEVMLAALEDGVAAENGSVPRHQIVGEHRDRVSAQFFQGIDFEFDVETGPRGKALAKLTQFRAVPALVQEMVALEKNVKFQ